MILDLLRSMLVREGLISAFGFDQPFYIREGLISAFGFDQPFAMRRTLIRALTGREDDDALRY